MSREITLRFDDPVYRIIRAMAEQENRSISNFVETAAIRFVHEQEIVNAFERAKIRGNAKLNRSLKRGHQDAKHRRGAFA